MAEKFLEIESVQRELELFRESGGAGWATPEWLTELLRSTWHHAYLAGDVDQYWAGMQKHQNPFMTREERERYYGRYVEK